MLKYILVSLKREQDKDPVNVAVPYEEEAQLQVLLSLLRLDDSPLNSNMVRNYHEVLLDKPDLGHVIDLSQFTHFVRRY